MKKIDTYIFSRSYCSVVSVLLCSAAKWPVLSVRPTVWSDEGTLCGDWFVPLNCLSSPISKLIISGDFFLKYEFLSYSPALSLWPRLWRLNWQNSLENQTTVFGRLSNYLDILRYYIYVHINVLSRHPKWIRLRKFLNIFSTRNSGRISSLAMLSTTTTHPLYLLYSLIIIIL